MGKVSFKALIRAVSYALGVIALSGCIMEPINLTNFVEDDEVIEIIDRGAGKVFVARDSDGQENPNLIGGNGKITVLYDNEYYMVEDWGENPPLGKQEPDKVMFVTANGTCTDPLTGIGRLTGKEKVITGLTNFHTYNVIPAQALTGTVSYLELGAALKGRLRQKATIDEEGAATLRYPENGGYIIFTPPLPSPIVNYDIVMTPVSTAGSASFVPLVSGDIVVEAAGGTIIDYIFYDKIFYKLYVLRVVFPEDTEPPEPEGIEVTLSYTDDNSPVPNRTTYIYSQKDDETIPFNITDAGNYTGITWYINGEVVGTGASFDLYKGLDQYKIIGVYYITVEAMRDDIPYSTAIKVEVTL
jgi:hypothetical protein